MQPRSLSVHTYKLRPKAGGPEREGALLRADFGAFGRGYADVHPWVELGDASLADELEALRKGRSLPLGARALTLAFSDAQARIRGVSLFRDLDIPESHYSFPWGGLNAEALAEVLLGRDFQRVKIKVGRDLGREVPFLADLARLLQGSRVKFRLDANGIFDEFRLETVLRELGEEFLDRVDYWEDPIPFESEVWERFSGDFEQHFALDRPLGKLLARSADLRGADVLVLKPSCYDPSPWVERAHGDLKRLVFTSSLDHPLGVVAAAWEAARAWAAHPLLVDAAGLLSFEAYEPDAFSVALRTEGSRLIAPQGTGFGFDRQLEALAWRDLA